MFFENYPFFSLFAHRKTNLELLMKSFVTSIFCSIAILANAQSAADFQHYNGLTSQGQIPQVFLTDIASGFNADLDIKEKLDSKNDRQYQEEFILSSNFFIRDLILSGQVSFGDPISLYLQEVKEKLLKDQPELNQNISVFIFKSPQVNAFATSKGLIFITTGLIARCNNPSELAFVIAHESGHYKMNHLLNGHLEQQKILEEEGKYFNSTWKQRQRAIFDRKQGDEFQADSVGKYLICLTDFDSEKGVDGTFDILHKSYLPFNEKQYERGFLKQYGVDIPACFYLESVKGISKEEDYFDNTHDHPNIHKRRRQLEYYEFDCKPFEKDEILEGKFENIKELARFETINQEVLNRDYGSAIYHSYLMLEHYENNQFLEVSIGKSLYGLTRYKIKREYSVVAESSSNIEGESQQIHFTLKQFTKEQLSSITLKYLWALRQKYPNEQSLTPLINGIVKDMVLDLAMTPEDFSKDVFKPEYTQTQEELDALDERRRKREEQKANRDFYKYLFPKEIDDEEFNSTFQKYYPLRDSIDYYNNLSFDLREKLHENKLEDREKNGYGIEANKLILLDPTYVVLGSKLDENDLEFERDSEELISIINEKAKESGVELNMLSTLKVTAEDGETLNDIFKLKEFMDEALLHNPYNITPTNYTSQQDLLEKYETRYLCSINVIGHASSSNTEYRFLLYDLKTGHLKYVNQTFGRKAKRLSKVEDFILNDFNTISK